MPLTTIALLSPFFAISFNNTQNHPFNLNWMNMPQEVLIPSRISIVSAIVIFKQKTSICHPHTHCKPIVINIYLIVKGPCV